MKLLWFLFAATKPTHWFIDGNNVIAHGKTAKDRDTLIEKLRGCDVEEVVLVFDGHPGATPDVSIDSNLKTVSLAEGLSTDDFIQEEIQKYCQDPDKRKHRVNLVSADRELRRQVLDYKPIVKTAVNPVTFFRRYLPRLLGLKKRSIDTMELN